MADTKYQIRAIYDDKTIRVYQAFNPQIATPALEAQKFVSPFGMDRMTWIKPSFNWMMYRCGFATKPNQETVLAIAILREGFEWALEHAVLSSYDDSLHSSREAWQAAIAASDVRVQWDPEKDWRLQPLPDIRTVQIGLRNAAVRAYVHEWTQAIIDVTPVAHAMQRQQSLVERASIFPSDAERPYPLNKTVAERIIPRPRADH